MSVTAVFFTVCALLTLVGALVTVGAKSPIRCAVGLLATIGIAAFLKLMPFSRGIQLIVYAGASRPVRVVVMLLGPDATPKEVGSARRAVAVRSAPGVVVIAVLGWGSSRQ